MASRVERVINGNTNAANNRTGDVAIPPGTEAVQVVLDRVLFQGNTDPQDAIADVTILVDGEYAGHVQWAGGVAASSRPGQTQLWSTAWWGIPAGTTLTVNLTPGPVHFNCRIDVDFF